MNIAFTRPAKPGFVPVADEKRIYSPDVLRGIAVLGILLMNIPEFSMPRRYSEIFRNNPQSVDFWIRAVVLVFWEGKMRALFSLLFGAGILLFIQNKPTPAGTVTRLFYRRMFWLLLLGLADAHLLLWEGDVLYTYAIAGMIAFLFRKVKAAYLVLAVPLVAVLEFTVQTLFYQDIREKRIEYVRVQKELGPGGDTTTGQRQALIAWRAVEETLIPNDQDIVENTMIMKSGYNTVAQKVRRQSWLLQTQYLVFMLWDPLALMLLGMALFKSGFLSGRWNNKQYKWMALAGYSIGLPLVILDFCYYYLYVPDLAASLRLMEKDAIPWINALYPVQRIAIMLAHIALVLLLIHSGRFTRILNALKATGQMALTNYVMQSVICTLLFFGYGFNFYGEWKYHHVFYAVAGIWLLQLAWSWLWLRYFRFGPLEWLWRTLTYWRIQPMRKPD